MHREPEPPATRKILPPDISMFPEFRKHGKSVRETERSEQKHAGRFPEMRIVSVVTALWAGNDFEQLELEPS